MPNNLETSTEIDASPAQVWTTVGDLTDMPRWSPQCRRVIARGPMQVGTRMVNINRSGWKVWPTQSMVTAYDEGKRVAFRVKENKSEWSFDLEPLDGGQRTRLTERRDVSRGTTKISKTLIDRFFGGNENFEQDLTAGMQQTLARIKAAAESGR